MIATPVLAISLFTYTSLDTFRIFIIIVHQRNTFFVGLGYRTAQEWYAISWRHFRQEICQVKLNSAFVCYRFTFVFDEINQILVFARVFLFNEHMNIVVFG